MKKGPFVFAVTRSDLIRVYGESRKLNQLIRRLEGSRDVQHSLELLLQFDDASWLQWASPTLSSAPHDWGAAAAIQ
jgi:hypothetical protein